MAVEDTEIEIEDDAVVTVDIQKPGEVTTEVQKTEDDSEVSVQPKEPQQQRVRQTKAELADATQALQEALDASENARKSAELFAQEQRRRAEESARLAQQRSEEVKVYQTQAEDRQTAIISNGIESAKSELEAARQEQQRAYEAGEFDKATAAGARMAKAAAALDRFETAKVDHDNRIKQQPRQQQVIDQQPSYQPQQQSDPFENFLANLAPRAQAWMRFHRDCAPPQLGGDAVAHAKAMKGHHAALAKGIQEGSDDYFKTIEEFTGYRVPANQQQVTQQPVQSKASVTTQATRTPIPAAPVSRDGNPVPQTGVVQNGKVRLSPAQQEIALISLNRQNNETEDAFRKRAFSSYASELVKATEEGKIGRLSH